LETSVSASADSSGEGPQDSSSSNEGTGATDGSSSDTGGSDGTTEGGTDAGNTDGATTSGTDGGTTDGGTTGGGTDAGNTDGGTTDGGTTDGGTTGGQGVCAPDPNDSDCAACGKMNCCEEVEACYADADCECYVQCIDDGGTIAACDMACPMAQNVPAFQDLLMCGTQSCALDCAP
jgi:hypothetical protein